MKVSLEYDIVLGSVSEQASDSSIVCVGWVIFYRKSCIIINAISWRNWYNVSAF